jgi:hypothetical protein
MNKLDKIIYEATLDAYNDYEQFSGWCVTLEENIRVPQECLTNGNPVTLTKIVDANGGLGINAVVRIGGKKGKKFLVPVESLALKNKRENAFIEAYKKWL